MKRTLPDTFRVDALFTLGTLALTGAAAAVVVLPKSMAPAPDPTAQAADLEERAQKLQLLEAEVRATEKSVGEQRQKDSQSVRLVTASAINDQLMKLAQAAKKCGVSISQITHAPPNTGDPRATIVAIRLAGEGRYTSVTNFLETLHADDPDTAVTAFKVNAAPSRTSPLASFTLELDWFTAPPGTTPAGSAGSAAGEGAPPK